MFHKALTKYAIGLNFKDFSIHFYTSRSKTLLNKTQLLNICQFAVQFSKFILLVVSFSINKLL